MSRDEILRGNDLASAIVEGGGGIGNEKHANLSAEHLPVRRSTRILDPRKGEAEFLEQTGDHRNRGNEVVGKQRDRNVAAGGLRVVPRGDFAAGGEEAKHGRARTEQGLEVNGSRQGERGGLLARGQ